MAIEWFCVVKPVQVTLNFSFSIHTLTCSFIQQILIDLFPCASTILGETMNEATKSLPSWDFHFSEGGRWQRDSLLSESDTGYKERKAKYLCRYRECVKVDHYKSSTSIAFFSDLLSTDLLYKHFFLKKIRTSRFTLVALGVLSEPGSFSCAQRENDDTPLLRDLGRGCFWFPSCQASSTHPQQVQPIHHNCPKWSLTVSHSLREYSKGSRTDGINAAVK